MEYHISIQARRPLPQLPTSRRSSLAPELIDKFDEAVGLLRIVDHALLALGVDIQQEYVVNFKKLVRSEHRLKNEHYPTVIIENSVCSFKLTFL